MKKQSIIETIAFAFIILFVYTALSKLFLFRVYLYDLGRSPGIEKFAPVLSILVPGSELLVSLWLIQLIFGSKNKRGFYGALALMSIFTLYVAYILIFTTKRPCTCGGIIRELSWPQHFIFNLCFTGLAIWGIWLQRRQKTANDTNATILSYS
ncbi:MauE/DoxX family redox-associated membrane protein [Mucilaginibacter paludis]|uniref:Methylamine utilisation protein MauE domain-containing protein n=1 Tax=Mucilaginibacter paludis DSM 18603 TaxID=714943 RepID=H1YBU8_9SPHI|nr:MauE/DoxX family redox-associated membrane protein [Mucilaginibacter paludis]EHQ27026.1 hypothetical protein Mucpa_2918 [Mucilaginibacter paludis DSM 18603]